MFNIIKSCFSNDSFYFVVTDTYIYIKNFKKILDLNDNELYFNTTKDSFKIKGKCFVVNRLEKNEVRINGFIESVIRYGSNSSK